jgi:acetylglutamate kinase
VSRLVVKVGGAVAESAAGTVLELAGGWDDVCVVHGAGPQISEEMERFGLEVEFVGGRRVTSPAALMLVRRSLAAVNSALCAAIGPLNVNADEAAAALAVGLGADRILFVTDVPGVLLQGSVVDTIAAGDADRLLDEGELDGGIVPKLRAAVTAARLGVRAEIGETAVTA